MAELASLWIWSSVSNVMVVDEDIGGWWISMDVIAYQGLLVEFDEFCQILWVMLGE